MGPARLVVGDVVEVSETKQLLDLEHALFGEGGGFVLLIDGVVAGGVLFAGLLALDDLAANEFGNDAVDLVILVGGFLAGAGNDEWGAGFVDQDRVDFVDDGVVVQALGAVLDAELHVVAEVVEAELVVGTVGDVGVVGVLALLVVEVVDDDTHLEAEELVELAHPLRVAAGEVVVDGDDVNALAGEGVQVAREGGDEGFAFTGFHFGDFALVEDHAAHQLDVEMAHVELAAAGLADHGKGWNQEVVEGGALSDLFFEFNSFGGQVDIGELAHPGFQSGDSGHGGQHGFDFTLVLGSEDSGQKSINKGHLGVSSRAEPASTILLCKERRPLRRRLSTSNRGQSPITQLTAPENSVAVGMDLRPAKLHEQRWGRRFRLPTDRKSTRLNSSHLG